MAKIVFLQRDSYESFGVMYLSAALSARGHQADVLVEGEERGKFFQRIAELSPDVLSFSLMSGLHDWAAATAAKVKARFGLPVIAGGTHCTFFPEFLNEPGLDAICRGEAEDALPDYLDALDRGEDGADVPGFWVKTPSGVVENDLYPLRPELDSLPFPDRTIYRKRYASLAELSGCDILAARGCPYSCAFCYNSLMRKMYAGKGRYVRRHSPERLMEELRIVRTERGGELRWVSFVDDLFIQDRTWLEAFLALYRREIGLPFSCGVRANLMDEELATLLAGSGCRMASFGLESGDANLRNVVLNKKISDEQIIRTARLLHGRGIRFSTFNMFNLPGETLEKAEATLDLNLRIRDGNYPWSGLLQPYRGTRVFDHADALGLIPQGETGAKLFHSATVRQADTELLSRFNAYFYWMVRYPGLRGILMRLVRTGPEFLVRLSLLLTSFHRYVHLMRPVEGNRAVILAVKNGWKRIRAYI